MLWIFAVPCLCASSRGQITPWESSEYITSQLSICCKGFRPCMPTHCPSSTGAIACLRDSRSEGTALLTEKLDRLHLKFVSGAWHCSEQLWPHCCKCQECGCGGFVQQHDAACTVFSDVHVSTSKADVSIACAGHPGFLQPARLRTRGVREPGLPHRALESV